MVNTPPHPKGHTRQTLQWGRGVTKSAALGLKTRFHTNNTNKTSFGGDVQCPGGQDTCQRAPCPHLARQVGLSQRPYTSDRSRLRQAPDPALDPTGPRLACHRPTPGYTVTPREPGSRPGNLSRRLPRAGCPRGVSRVSSQLRFPTGLEPPRASRPKE